MATTTTIALTQEQRDQIAESLRIPVDEVPQDIGIVAVSPEAAGILNVRQQKMTFLPAMLIT